MPDDNRFSTKPPLGLKPRFVHNRNRAIEIFQAMGRYVEAGQQIPRAWLDELCELEDVFEAKP